MSNGGRVRSGSILGPLLLIMIGGLILATNFAPGFNPWPWLAQYWPVLIILWGLFKLGNYFRFRDDPQRAAAVRVSGGEIVLVIFLVLCGSAFTNTYRRVSDWNTGTGDEFHKSDSVELGEAKRVDARIEMLSGDLKLTGGAGELVEADFDYGREEWEPRVDYSVAGERGRLTLRQGRRGRRSIRFGDDFNRWDVRLNSETPLTLEVKLGAGQGVLELGGMNLSGLDFEIGAGRVEVDLRGDWEQDLRVEINGGVGEAVIRLPRDVGVRVQAHGALGSIDVSGLKKRGDEYVNDALGKSPVTIRLEINGAIGSIEIIG